MADVSMEKIVSLAKRRGFVFPGSEIYGGLAGTWDYGPFGVSLKNNIKNLWWKMFVDGRDDMYGVDAAILMHPKVWEASGHVSGFSDPLVECGKCKKRFRGDHVGGNVPFPDHPDLFKYLDLKTLDIKKAAETFPEIAEYDTWICENCGTKNKVIETPVRQFNMMFKTNIGAMEDASSISYLRPETAGGIFVNFKNVVDTMRPKLPFGIGQIGKAFRNEIAPRDFIFRSREFEQMEIEYFVKPEDWERAFEEWRALSHEWIKAVGINPGNVHELEVADGDRAHYSKRTIDFEFDYPFGRKELYGLAYRTDFDLSAHSSASKEQLAMIEEDGTRSTPHVIEPSYGVDRTVLAVLVSAYREEGEGDDARVYLKFPKAIAPVKAALFPLVKNKPEIVGKAREIYLALKKQIPQIIWDDNGNVGKRYRRQDEIGTPFCITIDYQTLEDGTVTIRDRDTGEQERVATEDLAARVQA